MVTKWHGETTLRPKAYICGYCGVTVGPDKGSFSAQENTNVQTFIFFCSNCSQPTYFDHSGRQVPGVKFGKDVQHLPRDVEQLYGEARVLCPHRDTRPPCWPAARF